MILHGIALLEKFLSLLCSDSASLQSSPDNCRLTFCNSYSYNSHHIHMHTYRPYIHTVCVYSVDEIVSNIHAYCVCK